MINKKFDRIELSDIQLHYETLIREIKTTEFKRELKFDDKSQVKEFLYDISSFANSSGGDIFYGIDEKEGLRGFPIDSLDQFVLKIEQLIRSGINPRITYRIKEYQLSNDQYVLFIRITKSSFSPHQVVIYGSDKFWARGENGKFKLDVFQLRDLIVNSVNEKDKINEFIIDRVSQIFTGNTPIQLRSSPKIIFHAIPIQSFLNNEDLKLFLKWVVTDNFRPINSSGFDKRINFDGLLTFSPSHQIEKDSYLQVYRNGVIESVDTSILSPDNSTTGEKVIPATRLEDILLSSLHYHFKLLQAFNVRFPVVMFFNIIGVKEYTLATDKFTPNSIRLRRNHLKFDEILFEESFGSFVKAPKPWFDHLWQAFGHERSPNFLEDGWHGLRKIREY